MTRHGVVTRGNFPVRARQYPSSESHEEEYQRKDRVGLERKDEEREQRKAPHDKVQCYRGVILDRRRPLCCTGPGLRVCLG